MGGDHIYGWIRSGYNLLQDKKNYDICDTCDSTHQLKGLYRAMGQRAWVLRSQLRPTSQKKKKGLWTFFVNYPPGAMGILPHLRLLFWSNFKGPAAYHQKSCIVRRTFYHHFLGPSWQTVSQNESQNCNLYEIDKIRKHFSLIKHNWPKLGVIKSATKPRFYDRDRRFRKTSAGPISLRTLIFQVQTILWASSCPATSTQNLIDNRLRWS